ncbi:DHA2 family efflux MFS transporter permease subunit [Sporomusa sp. KB1]|jgi:DHA2 family multidrug resistance protein|uniref:DHA2 family efflux MFS transporter permease subunit n=1 Tax=Sporomusa sp. KB1 TaxID=943346 RepID=UPI0011A487AD|nr:DHA2 family efflux MFS transporter permease subunit [Sporomusa sp. KB1]TWH51711.1 DHA2 family multidrug resistance protein [Sporomusa sp. KB1]
MMIPRLAIDNERYKWAALGVTLIGGFMSTLDTSIINVAVPKMMAAFAVGTEDAQWILTAYMLTMGVLQPASGYLCNSFGTRRMYLLSLFIFTVGSLLCSLAWSDSSMIVFRIVQALGGGLILPVGMSIVLQNFSPAERNLAMGIWGICVAVAPAIGPTLGGYLIDEWSWHYIFTINLPIGILGYLLAALTLKESRTAPDLKFDFAGFIFCATGLFCLLLALSKGVDKGWDSFYIISLLYTAFATLTLFVLIELNTDAPLLDLSLFRDWNFMLGNIFSFINYTILLGSLFLIPLFFQNILNYTAMQTGLLLLPAGLISGALMPVAAKVADKIGTKPVVIFASLCAMAGTFPLMYLDLDTSPAYVLFIQLFRGIFVGCSIITVTVLSMSRVPREKISQASAINNTIRQVSGSFGIAVLSTVLQNRQIYHLDTIASHINITSKATVDLLAYGKQLFMRQGSTEALAQQQALVLINGLVKKQMTVFSFDDAFWVLGIFAVFCLLVSLLLKAAPITKTKTD